MKIPSPRIPLLVAAYLDDFDKIVHHEWGDDQVQKALREFAFCWQILRREIGAAQPVIKKLQLGEPLTVEEEVIKLKLYNFLAHLEFEYTAQEAEAILKAGGEIVVSAVVLPPDAPVTHTTACCPEDSSDQKKDESSSSQEPVDSTPEAPPSS